MILTKRFYQILLLKYDIVLILHKRCPSFSRFYFIKYKTRGVTFIWEPSLNVLAVLTREVAETGAAREEPPKIGNTLAKPRQPSDY